MKLKELKTAVYELLEVTTTKEVKALYPDRILTKPTEWEAILDELTAKSENDTESTELYGFPESETVLTGKTGKLTEAFAIATDNNLEPSDGEPDAPMAPVPVALWDFMPGHNLTDVLSPWAHYLQWLDRLYTKASIAFKFTLQTYQNA